MVFKLDCLRHNVIEINLSDHNLHDGDLVVYSSSGIGTLTNLNEGEAYYIKKVDSNTVKLAYTGENVRRGQYFSCNLPKTLQVNLRMSLSFLLTEKKKIRSKKTS